MMIILSSAITYPSILLLGKKFSHFFHVRSKLRLIPFFISIIHFSSFHQYFSAIPTSWWKGRFRTPFHTAFPLSLFLLSLHAHLLIKVPESCLIGCGHRRTIGFRPDKESRRIIFRNISSIIPDGASVNKCAVSISSLVRTGLVSTTFSEYITDETMYEPIKKISIYSEIETQCIASNKELLFQKGFCNLTPLGNEFILSCVS